MSLEKSLIDKYLEDKDSICREERQYAVFLYNYLNSMKGKGWSDDKEGSLKCKLFGKGDIQIKHVFYEATFMRDFFYWDRKEREKKKYVENENLSKERFNKYLLDYVKEIVTSILDEDENKLKKDFDLEFGKLNRSNISLDKFDNLNEEDKKKYYEYHLGMAIGREVGKKDKKDILDLGENINLLLKALMNSKPDIAVIFEKKNSVEDEVAKSYLSFFECKFESPEGSSGKKEAKISQTEAQNAIAYFLTKYFGKKNDDSDKIYQVADDWEKTRIVNFYRDKAKNNEGEVDICISSLIEFNSNHLNKLVY